MHFQSKDENYNVGSVSYASRVRWTRKSRVRKNRVKLQQCDVKVVWHDALLSALRVETLFYGRLAAKNMALRTRRFDAHSRVAICIALFVHGENS